jgi:hypothetical protein
VQQPRSTTVGPLKWAFTLCSLLWVLVASLGASAASAADYPLPTSGQGSVDASSVQAGSCVNFSGGGFKPGTRISIADNGRPVGTTRADAHGNFTHQVCFGTDAKLGKHTLTAAGVGANGASRVVSAVVYVNGVSSSPAEGPGGGNGAGNGATGGGLPFTGADIRDLVILGVALSLTGIVLVRRGQRRRPRRTQRAPA